MRTACTHDCPDACGLRVSLDADGVPLIAGAPDHPITRGFVCYRVRAHGARLRDPARVTSPRVRRGERWQELSWDAALDLAADKLQRALDEHGAPSVFYLRGGGCLGLSKNLIDHFFHSLGPVTGVRGGVCGEAGEAAQALDFGQPASHDYTDMERSAAVVLWGKDPVVTGVHLVPLIKRARERGAPVVLIDPAPLRSAPQATQVIRLAPGSDSFLALAVLQRLRQWQRLDPAGLARADNFADLERLLAAPELSAEACAQQADVDLAQVDLLARLYAERRPLGTWIGWGLQRHHGGGHAVRCIDALGLLSGNVGLAGGGVNFTSWRRRGLDLSRLCAATGRTVAAHDLGHQLPALADPPLRLAYLAAANPVAQYADSRAVARALGAVDFTVVADAFFTDTAQAADLVLPVQLMLEQDDVVGSYQHHHVATAARVVEAPGEARCDLWILRQLGRRLGLDDDPLLADPAAALAQITAPWFPGGPAPHGRNPAQPEVPFAHRFATSSGAARLVTDAPAPGPADPRYPLLLLSLADHRYQCSQIPEPVQAGPLRCTVHPDAARAAGLPQGGPSQLVSPLGALEVELRLDPRLHPRVCLVRRGGWLRHGRAANALIRGRATDLGGGTAFYSQGVRLEPPGR